MTTEEPAQSNQKKEKKLKKKKRSKEELSLKDVDSPPTKQMKVPTEKDTDVTPGKVKTDKKQSGLSKEAIKEKKREKRKKKKEEKQKQKLISKGKCSDEKTEIAKTQAISYLHLWKNNKTEWNFQKVRQVWLLQNLYKSDLVSDEDFAVLLEYMEGMKGKARELTVEKAENIMKAEDSESEKDTATGEEHTIQDTNSDETKKKLQRARDLIQLLS